MELNLTALFELREAWKNLCSEAADNRKFNFELFEATFTQTYSLLREQAAETILPKQCVRLVAEAFLFASIKDDSLETEYLAAAVLTERMLNSFAFGNTAESAGTSIIYILESHEELLLNFDNVEKSISLLTAAYDAR